MKVGCLSVCWYVYMFWKCGLMVETTSRMGCCPNSLSKFFLGGDGMQLVCCVAVCTCGDRMVILFFHFFHPCCIAGCGFKNFSLSFFGHTVTLMPGGPGGQNIYIYI